MLSTRIDCCLQKMQMSRRCLAKKSGIPTSTLQSAMERGDNMTIKMVEKIASALSVSPAWLCGWSDEI
ncbi:MAG: helix-turn-helix transcriptional regulator [Clostridia bacterium]|nr:helix-turn-helix transcriptional regulator [Clostridia bacterium]